MWDITPERWNRLRPILEAALEAPVEAQLEVVDRACGNDAVLRAEIHDLLRRSRSSHETMFERPLKDVAGDLLAEVVGELEGADDFTGWSIGPYRVIRELARGGMAVVYLAERADRQFEQRVVIKVLRHTLESPDLVRRFLAERQILASLHHPHIARLLDGGVTPPPAGGIPGARLPYIVMEYVEGERLDRYCAGRRLTRAARVTLFRQVAAAVQYAHLHLVVHRDLKPSNVLVTADGEARLLDFGIAKLLSATQDPDGEATGTGHAWLTPDYAAPEQHQGGTVTTATDVYQLGVLLFELLTGRRLIEAGWRRGSGVASQEPPDLEPVLASAPELTGDFVWILRKALRTISAERYQSVDSLLDDLDRLETGLPVRARHGSATYRLRKFLQRHRWGLSAAGAVLVLLATYAATVTVQGRQVRAALARATEAGAKAQGTTQFLIRLFASGDPREGLGDTLTAEQLLQRGLQRAEDLKGQPLVQAQMLAVLGQVYLDMQRYDRAESLLRRSLELRRTSLGEMHADVAVAMNSLAAVLRRYGRYEEARELSRRALVIQRRVLGNNDPALAISMESLSRVPGTPATESISLNREALTILKRAHGSDHPLVAAQMATLADFLRNTGRFEEAETLLEESLAILRRWHGSDHLEVSTAMLRLGYVLDASGRYNRAEDWFRQAWEVELKQLGPTHPRLGAVLVNLSEVRERQGDLSGAESYARQALAIRERAHGPASLALTASLGQLANVLRRRAMLDEAVALRRRELGIFRAHYGPSHTHVAGSMSYLGLLLYDQGRTQEAERMLQEAISIRTALFGAGSTHIAGPRINLGEIKRRQGQFAAAESLYRSALASFRAGELLGSQESFRSLHLELALLYTSWGKPESAAVYRRAASAR